MTKPKVAYVLLRFPRLTETFVAEEMRSLQRNGVELRIYSLLGGREELIHPTSQELMPAVQHAPGLVSGSLWLAQAYFLFKAPARYLGLLATILKPPAPRPSFYVKRVDIFLKGVWIARQLEHATVDAVHTHFAWLSTVAAIAISGLLGIPFTFTAHAYDIYSQKNDLLRLAASLARGIVTISEANKAAILAMDPGLPAERVTVIRCGVDLGFFRPPTARRVHQTIQITSVGRLLEKKGHEYLIRACAKLQAQHFDFHCVIAGSGELLRSLEALILELRLQDRVILAGAQERDWVRERLCESDVFVLACVTEAGGDRDGIPVSIMEAMAMGVPVISTPVSGIPELVRHEETGLLVPERNASELASAVICLSEDQILRQRVTQNALGLVQREYDVRQNTSRLRSFFRQTIEASDPHRENVA